MLLFLKLKFRLFMQSEYRKKFRESVTKKFSKTIATISEHCPVAAFLDEFLYKSFFHCLYVF